VLSNGADCIAEIAFIARFPARAECNHASDAASSDALVGLAD